MSFVTKNKPLIFGFLAAFLLGTHSVIVRYLTADLHGMTIAVLRLYIAAAALFLILKILKTPISINFKDPNLIAAAVATAVNYIFFHVGLEHTSAANAMMLENTAPFFVLLFLFFLVHEKIRKRDMWATAIAIVGVPLTISNDFSLGGEELAGDFLEIIAGIIWAVFIISSSRAVKGSASTGERLNFLFWVFVLAGLLLTPALPIYSIEATANDILWLFILGIVPTALAYYFWFEAAAQVSTVTSSLMYTLAVIFTFINAALFLGEKVGVNAIFGAGLIVCGVLITSSGGNSDKGENQQSQPE